MSKSWKQPLGPSLLSNTTNLPPETAVRGLDETYSLTKFGPNVPQESNTTHSRHAQEGPAPHKPYGSKRYLLASPRTTKKVIAQVKELAKKVPRSWDDAEAAAKCHPLRHALKPPRERHRENHRVSRSEASSPRRTALSGIAERENVSGEWTPREINLKEQVSVWPCQQVTFCLWTTLC